MGLTESGFNSKTVEFICAMNGLLGVQEQKTAGSGPGPWVSRRMGRQVGMGHLSSEDKAQLKPRDWEVFCWSVLTAGIR